MVSILHACPNRNPANHLDNSVEPLRLPLDSAVAIDKYDPLWSFLEVNPKKYLKPHRGNQGAQQPLFHALFFILLDNIRLILT